MYSLIIAILIVFMAGNCLRKNDDKPVVEVIREQIDDSGEQFEDSGETAGHSKKSTDYLKNDFLINAGAESTNSQLVTLSLFAEDAEKMLISLSEFCLDSDPWIQYKSTTRITLDETNGLQSVSVKFLSYDGIESECMTKSVEFDNTPPELISSAVNNNSEYLTSGEIRMAFNVTDAAEIFIGQSGDCISGRWMPYQKHIIVTPEPLSKETRISYRFKDKLGNHSSCINHALTYDVTAPTKSGYLDDGEKSSSLASVRLKWGESQDPESGLEFYEVSVGTKKGLSDVRSWVKVGLRYEALLKGLDLEEGKIYFGNVRGVNRAGLVGETESGDGFIATLDQHLSSGRKHSCALNRSGDVICWGNNHASQLGLESRLEHIGDDPDDMEKNVTKISQNYENIMIQISSGGYHTCALFDTGEIRCWGLNESGQLGTGNFDFLLSKAEKKIDAGPGLVGTQIVAGGQHTCGLFKIHTSEQQLVKCWGDNSSGQLGVVISEDSEFEVVGFKPSDMGANLLAVDLDSSESVLQVVAGDEHSCALLANGRVKCWGENHSGQLGLGDFSDRGPEFLRSGGKPEFVLIEESSKIVWLSTSGHHTCALTASGKVVCWGENSSGQIGPARAEPDIEDGEDEDRDYDLYEFPVVLDHVPGKVRKIAAGTRHTCALLETNEIYCWGDIEDPVLGLAGGEPDFSYQTESGSDAGMNRIKLGTDDPVRDLSSGHGFSCVMFQSGLVKCWGRNHNGQLGQGHDLDIGNNDADMGENLKNALIP